MGWSDPQQVAESKPKVDFTNAKKSVSLDEKPWWENNGESSIENSPVLKETIMTANEEATEDKEEEEEEAEEEAEEEEEEEGEWEYYYDEDEGEEDVSETLDAATQRRATDSETDERKEWIIQGLQQIIPKMPSRIKEAFEQENSDGDEDVFDDKEEDEELKIKQMTEPDQKGYKDWLDEAAFDLKENGIASLEIMSPVSEETPSIEETVIELTEEEKKTRSKASKIVDKLRNTEGSDLKKVLFSLKTFFQEDKNLVHEFNRVGGLAQLVVLGKDDEPQLQNFILRALGQI